MSNQRKIKLAIFLCIIMASVEICGNNFADKTGALAVVKGNISNIEVPDRSNRSIKVSGHITDSAGEAATGQSVTLEKQLLYHTDAGNNEKWFKYDEETTDDNGNYSIPAENNNVYRISVGKDVPVHSGSVWARDNDENIDLSVTLHSLQGKVSTESGKAAEGIYVAIKRVGGINAYGENAATTSGQPVSTSDTEDEIETESDPVREANFNDQMVSIQSDKNGLFTFSEVCDGAYEVIVGRTGKLSSQIVVMGDSFVNVPVTDEDAKVEKYRNQILEDKERSNDYATELDLPGYLIPTPSPTPRAEEMAKPDLKGKLLFDGETVYTKYNYTIEDYAHRQYANVPRIPEKKYLELLDPTKDQTKGMQFLRVDEYRPVNEKEYIKQFQSMIESFCRASGKSPQSSSLYGHGMDMIKAAKKNKIDLIFMTVQTFLESAYGTSHLASGNKITKVALPGYPRTGGGKFLTKSLKKPVKVYNLYGIKAVDSDPYVGGTSHAYYSGWTTPEKAIYGAAAFLKHDYIHSEYHQNTAFKIRYNPTSVWHQYATGPDYAQNLGKYMIGLANVYSARASFTYDLPKYLPSNKEGPEILDPGTDR